MLERAELQRYMHARIPISQAMDVAVVGASADAVTLAAPLAPNINHRDTIFGGSACAVALLAAWALLLLRLKRDGLDGYIVVRRHTMNYERPMPGDFTATAAIDGAVAWPPFVEALQRKHRARIFVTVLLECRNETVATLEGEFAVVAPGRGRDCIEDIERSSA